MHGDRHRFDQRRMFQRQRVGQPVENVGRHGDELGEGAMATIVAARDAEHLPIVAEIHATLRGSSRTRRSRRSNRTSPARRRRSRAPSAPTASMTPAASCPITSGGIRRPVEPSYPWTSLPQMPHAPTRTSTSSAPIVRRRHLDDVQFAILAQQQGLHLNASRYSVESMFNRAAPQYSRRATPSGSAPQRVPSAASPYFWPAKIRKLPC